MAKTRSLWKELPYEIEDLLDIPRTAHKTKRTGREYKTPDKGYQILLAIVRTMREALLRGESISIKGFGVFRVKTRPARIVSKPFVYKKGKVLIQSQTSIMSPPKKVIVFKPAASLQALVSIGHGTYLNNKEQRAIVHWR